MKICKIYDIEGRVQGVGFRPFVYTLALGHNLKGVVFNQASGVHIEVEGEAESFCAFERELRESIPPLARVDGVEIIQVALRNFEDFKIIKSQSQNLKSTLIVPDMSLCEDCAREMEDKNDRRFGYPLINCTNCGPRYSIMESVPYDRENTSMRAFQMCPECEREYKDPLNRRYHAQPISCPRCGPAVRFYDVSEGSSTRDLPLQKLSHAITAGRITALKGMGGFHIICDALNESAILRLREQKRRPAKPFAVLFGSLEMIKRYCDTTKEEESALLSAARPIVLVSKKKECTLPDIIAPNINTLGVFLPYTPLHTQLLELTQRPLIATSANISGEPIITSKEQLGKLGGVIEAFVDFERDIVNFSDDSVVQFADKRAIVLRLSRGLTPKSFKTFYGCDKKILALGAHQKSTIAIFNGSNIIISPHIGDLDSVESVEAYKRTIASFIRFYDFAPHLLVCDAHPNYASSLWAKKQNIPTLNVQHHYAHILAVMFEQGIDEEVLGVSWDGTGLGDDNSIWGGEFFLCDMKAYKRVHTFAPFKLLGGDKSVKNINRTAFSILYPHRERKEVAAFLDSFKEKRLLEQSYEKDINALLCHSVGRLFDAAAAIILQMKTTTYEGESGMMIEALYDESINESYEIKINDKGEIEYSHWFLAMLGERANVAATKFINTLALVLLQIAKKYDKKVVLSGGVFQNKTLLKKLLKSHDIEFVTARDISPNDSSISLGQIVYALNHI
ncbi:MAG: carbamoyltransferase HypF [Campylobacteraceae bacterium]|jgi:hydrogenase maturation protein HypF|nr:carbamoyltransferase HypF [Campylobacteraceae bacterium]